MVKRLPQPPQSAALFASDLLAGLEQAPLNQAWLRRTRLVWPVDA